MRSMSHCDTVRPKAGMSVFLRTSRYPVGYSIIQLDTVSVFFPHVSNFISLKFCWESASSYSGRMLAFLHG
jgi:hypothetical protein